MKDLNDRSWLKIPSDEWNFDGTLDPEMIEQTMIMIMTENRGIGLAANQIGFGKRVFVLGNESSKELPRPFALFNPSILGSDTETDIYEEGCLSFPQLYLKISRPKKIQVEYFDRKGDRHQEELDGLFSRCFQHELDHLNGVCFIDKTSKLKLNLALKKERKRNQ